MQVNFSQCQKSGKTIQLNKETIDYLKEHPNRIIHTNSPELAELLKNQFPTVTVHLYKHKFTSDIFWNFANEHSLWVFKDEMTEKKK